MNKILGVIPARYGSTRFPGKPLADIAGRSMVQRVYEQVRLASSVNRVIVATDHTGIFEHVQGFGGTCVMTNENHPTGTDRCYEAYMSLNEEFDYVINIQGDEPFIQPDQINQLCSVLDGKTEIATLVKRIENPDELENTGEVKVVTNIQGEALYFSRTAIPFIQGVERIAWIDRYPFFKHVGLYAFRHDILSQLTALPVSSLERAESLEQLRWLENGFRIMVAETETESLCIETPDDLRRAVAYIREHK